MNIPHQLVDRLSNLPAPAAYNVLVALGHAEDTFYSKGSSHRVKDWVQKDEISWLLAHQTEVLLFWGGPPNRLNYYHGNLFTLMMDRIRDFLTRSSLLELYQALGILK